MAHTRERRDVRWQDAGLASLQAALHLRPSILSNYLYDLAKTFNRFYENCPIKGSEYEIKNCRLSLVMITQMSLKRGLKLLGISTPERM